jgi:hypothetical protein
MEPPFFRMAPPPRNPIPVKIPNSKRIRSITAKELDCFPSSGSRMLACIMAIEAARATRIVVRRPAAWPRAPRLNPINAPAIIVNRRRTMMSFQVGKSGICIGLLLASKEIYRIVDVEIVCA